jgi:hypothetical protein
MIERPSKLWGTVMAKKRKSARREFSIGDEKELRLHAKLNTPIKKIAMLTGRTEGSVRQKAIRMGLPLAKTRYVSSKSSDA